MPKVILLNIKKQFKIVLRKKKKIEHHMLHSEYQGKADTKNMSKILPPTEHLRAISQ